MPLAPPPPSSVHLQCCALLRDLDSFPTRRSSDLIKPQNLKLTARGQIILLDFGLAKGQAGDISRVTTSASIDRKSTRLNSSHLAISYAVFCLKERNSGRISPDPSSLSFHARSSRS